MFLLLLLFVLHFLKCFYVVFVLFVFNVAANWKRTPGRPQRNWLQQVEEDIGLSVGAARIAGQDRSMWRTLRPSAGQAQQWVSE